MGYNPGPFDGLENPLTVAAWNKFLDEAERLHLEISAASLRAALAPPAAVDHFPAVLQFILKWEGTTFENDPSDPGGATKFGIDQRSHPNVDIRNLTLAQATEIYHEEWLKDMCDKLPFPVSAAHFNYCVNTGSGESVKFLQRALGVTDDGQFGPETQAALVRAEAISVALSMVDHADDFYKHLAANGMEKFLRGWLNRNADLRKFIHSTI